MAFGEFGASGGHAAIDVQRFTRHEAGIFGGKEQRCARAEIELLGLWSGTVLDGLALA